MVGNDHRGRCTISYGFFAQNDLTVQIPESKAYNSAAYLKNASVSKYSEERMKEMLLNDHAVSIMLYMKESYVNPDTAAYCYPVGKSNSTVINHIVTVVGWDDTYSKDNFLPVSNVTSDGAVDHQKQLGEKKETEDITIFSYDPNISKLVRCRGSGCFRIKSTGIIIFMMVLQHFQ